MKSKAFYIMIKGVFSEATCLDFYKSFKSPLPFSREVNLMFKCLAPFPLHYMNQVLVYVVHLSGSCFITESCLISKGLRRKSLRMFLFETAT